jgi:Protein of unknown function (DUF3499)
LLIPPCYGSAVTAGIGIHRETTCSHLPFTAVSSVSDAPLRRQCSRPDCSERAGVTLSYEYARSQVWLDELRPERDPHAYDLCRRHAARLSVPQGWRLADRRRLEPAPPADLPSLLAG